MQVTDLMQRNVISAVEDDNLGLALQLMLWNRLRHLPVRRAADGRVTGVISERDILRAQHQTGDAGVLKRQVRAFMTSPAEHIHPAADIADAAADFVQKRISCLPVIEGGELVGIITTSDLLATLAQCPADRIEAQSATAKEIGSIADRTPIRVHPSDSLVEAAAQMLNRGARHACVVDGDGRVLGMLSHCDVRHRLGDPRRSLAPSTLPAPLAALTVGAVMSANPRMLTASTAIDSAVNTLLDQALDVMPVVDEEQRLLGIVSALDLLRHLRARTGQGGGSGR